MSASTETIAAAAKAAANADNEYFRIRLPQVSPSRGDKRKGIGVMKRSPAAPARCPKRAGDIAVPGSRLTS